ncbi:MAG TPA: signal peptidase I [Verrucomicrobiae bacterium]|nr:signal peptidase I [Verrucomicrobiae bacterium]
MVNRLVTLLFLVGVVITLLTAFPVLSHKTYVVVSGSMGKNVPKGSLIITRTQNAYRVGDIVTFPLPGSRHETVTHRVVSVRQSSRGEYLETKGDANPNGDGWKIPTEAVLGRVSLVIPYIGHVAFALQSLPGYLFFALVTLLFIVLPLIREAAQSFTHFSEGR